MLSSSPPPVDDQVEEDEDDEFGDFRVADHSLSFAGTLLFSIDLFFSMPLKLQGS